MENRIQKNEISIRLAESLKELAKTQSIDKITIKDITDKAGVIRPTFYHHFQDKYELIEWIMMVDLVEPLLPLVENDMLKEAMVLLFTNMEKDKIFYSRAVKIEGAALIQRGVKKILLEWMENAMSGKTPKHRWLTPDVVSSYYAESMCFVAEYWIKQDMVLTPQEMAEAYHYIATRSLADVMKEL